MNSMMKREDGTGRAPPVTAHNSPAGNGNPYRRHLFEYVSVKKKALFRRLFLKGRQQGYVI
jgi:hypothetical protein